MCGNKLIETLMHCTTGTGIFCAGFCRHVFNNHILGLAGSFSQGQLTDLKRCLPDDCIDYIEEDVKVLAHTEDCLPV